MEEQFETFDDSGRPAGLVPRSRVHQEGLWHKSVNVFLFDSDGRLLIQRRHPDKDVWPGAWDLSVGEHLKPGETYEKGAQRGLWEELGLRDVILEPVGSDRKQRLENREAGIKDYELQRIFRGVFQGEISPEPDEVTETRMMTLEELAEALADRPDDFTPWFRECVAETGLLGT